jgi:F-type H+-transporting ATPase subunit delta
MAELATIARPYAEALFKAQASDLAGTAAWLDELAAVADNAQLQQFVDSPKVSDEQAFELISGVVRTALPEAGKNFLQGSSGWVCSSVVFVATAKSANTVLFVG